MRRGEGHKRALELSRNLDLVTCGYGEPVFDIAPRRDVRLGRRLAQHADEHRMERPVLLVGDEELAEGASSPFVAVGSGYYIGLGKIGGTPASPLAGGLPPLVDSDRRLAVRRGLPLMGWAVQESQLR